MSDTPIVPFVMTASYFRAAFNQRTLVQSAEKALQGIQYDTLVGTGLSGAVAVPLLAYTLRKNFVLVRKPDDNTNHSYRSVEGTLGNRWVFVDDFISTGKTLKRVMETVKEFARDYSRDRNLLEARFTTEFVGALVYDRSMSPHTHFYPSDSRHIRETLRNRARLEKQERVAREQLERIKELAKTGPLSSSP